MGSKGGGNAASYKGKKGNSSTTLIIINII